MSTATPHKPSSGNVIQFSSGTGFASATDRSVASPNGAFDAGPRPGSFPDRTASLLLGSLAITRTGLTPAGDDELPIRS
jgi:hypothetical protein